MGNIMDDWFGFDPPPKPQLPDPVSTANTQSDYNAQQAALQSQYNLDALRTNIAANRLDQATPFMNISYNPTGTDQFGNTTYGATTSYTPEQQALLDMIQGSQGELGTFGRTLVDDLSANPIYNQGIPDFTDMASPLMDRHLDIMNPYFEQQLNKLDADMRNQGLMPGMPAYDNAMRAIRQTHAESVGQFANQSIPTVMSMYNQPFDVIQKIMGMSGPVSMPNLGVQSPPSVNMGSPTVEGVDFSGITTANINALMKQYEQEMARYSSDISALTGIAGTVLGAPGGTVVGNLMGSAGSGLANMLGLGGAAGTTGSSLPLFRLPTPAPRAA